MPILFIVFYLYIITTTAEMYIYCLCYFSQCSSRLRALEHPLLSLHAVVIVLSLSHVRFFVICRLQAPLSIEFSRQEYWSGWVAILLSRGSSRSRN